MLTIDQIIELEETAQAQRDAADREPKLRRACESLVAAYTAGSEKGGSVDWTDIDFAVSQALLALGIENPTVKEFNAQR